MTSAYRRDLAWIHHTGFSEFAQSITPGVVATLQLHGIHDGLVVDAGCGTGVLAANLTRAGFRVLGFDSSPAMIALARTTAPAATFERSALDETVFPCCSAILATGEVLNYASTAETAAFIEEASAALSAGGVLLFDVAEAGMNTPPAERRLGGHDWSVILLEELHGATLTRRVLSFRMVDGAISRDEETHTLELRDRGELRALLASHGFRVRVRRSYGRYRLPPGRAGYVAVRR